MIEAQEDGGESATRTEAEGLPTYDDWSNKYSRYGTFLEIYCGKFG